LQRQLFRVSDIYPMNTLRAHADVRYREAA